ncbi:hypothetical protein [Sphaerisporangium aureirubrum]|uniref:Uncharacterized protein n=1 Tax=Sphaerisporangium aureirubrum TaxID=1544736 RepID=A0ABW1NNA4_9ACTN
MRSFGSRRVLPTVLLIFAVFYLVRDPHGAAMAAKAAMNAITTMADAFNEFFNSLN